MVRTAGVTSRKEGRRHIKWVVKQRERWPLGEAYRRRSRGQKLGWGTVFTSQGQRNKEGQERRQKKSREVWGQRISQRKQRSLRKERQSTGSKSAANLKGKKPGSCP